MIQARSRIHPKRPAKLQRNILLPQDLCADRVINIRIHIGNLIRQAHNLALQRMGNRLGLVIEDTVTHLPCQVQPLSVFLQFLHDAHALLIVFKTAFIDLIQNKFPRMAKRRVSQIMAQRNGLHQILVHPQCLGDGSGILRHLQCVGHAGPIMIPHRR